MYNCKYCNKTVNNLRSKASHEAVCSLNPNRVLTPFERGIPPFKNKVNIHNIGENEQHDDFNRECPVCHRWFNAKSIGGHVVNCREINQTNKDDEFVVLKDKTVLNITNSQLKKYQEKNTTCEICGKTLEESVKTQTKFSPKRLCIDHNHKTGLFRGLLCSQCNRALGWFENNKENIEAYLNKDIIVE